MQLHIVPANDNPSIAAIAYGPVILAGEMGTGSFSGREPYSDPTKHNDYITYNYTVPGNIDTTFTLDAKKIDNYIQPLQGRPLTFKIVNENIIVKPLYDVHHERYVVYWQLKK